MRCFLNARKCSGAAGCQRRCTTAVTVLPPLAGLDDNDYASPFPDTANEKRTKVMHRKQIIMREKKLNAHESKQRKTPKYQIITRRAVFENDSGSQNSKVSGYPADCKLLRSRPAARYVVLLFFPLSR